MGKSVVFYARKPYDNVVATPSADVSAVSADAQDGVAA
jgi:hypothetical protein